MIFFFFTGDQEEAKHRGRTDGPKQYGTTVPLLLKGKDQRPLSELRAGVNTTIVPTLYYTSNFTVNCVVAPAAAQS